MRLALTLLLALAVCFAATSAYAAMPAAGIYNTPSLGGTVLEGRGTNSWALPANGAAGNGDVWNTMSWDGVTLGTEWKFQCAVSPAVQLVNDFRVNGTGVLIHTTSYSGGSFFLSKNGPWGDTVNDYTGTIGTTQIITTLQYVSGVLISGRENINSSGMFDGSDCVLTFLLTNGVRLSDTDSGALPPNYPGFLDPNCQPTRIYGSWSDIVDLSLQIDCPVPVNTVSWGELKTTYP